MALRRGERDPIETPVEIQGLHIDSRPPLIRGRLLLVFFTNDIATADKIPH